MIKNFVVIWLNAKECAVLREIPVRHWKKESLCG